MLCRCLFVLLLLFLLFCINMILLLVSLFNIAVCDNDDVTKQSRSSSRKRKKKVATVVVRIFTTTISKQSFCIPVFCFLLNENLSLKGLSSIVIIIIINRHFVPVFLIANYSCFFLYGSRA